MSILSFLGYVTIALMINFAAVLLITALWFLSETAPKERTSLKKEAVLKNA